MRKYFKEFILQTKMSKFSKSMQKKTKIKKTKKLLHIKKQQ